jgi:uncharacterized membrane protein YkvA (DUF1232 family)
MSRIRDWAQRLKTEMFALYLAARDPRTPWYARWLVAAVIAYALSPIDLIPDFVPVLGLLDDLIIVPLGITLALRVVPPEVIAEARQRASAELAVTRRRSRAVVAVVVSIWIGAAVLTGILVLRALD